MGYSYPNRKQECVEESDLECISEKRYEHAYPRLTLTQNTIPLTECKPLPSPADEEEDEFLASELYSTPSNSISSPLTTYFKTISRLPLLNEQQEKILATRIKEREEALKGLVIRWRYLFKKEFLDRYPPRQRKIVNKKINNLNGAFHLFDDLLMWERERKRILRELTRKFHSVPTTQELQEVLYKIEAEISKCIAETNFSQAPLKMLEGNLKKLSQGMTVTKKQKSAEQELRSILRKIGLILKEIKSAKNDLVQANLRLVISIAKKYPQYDLPLSDLIQEGNLGLIRAIDTYDYRRGHRFITYAAWWIRQAIIRSLDCQAKTVRTPVYVKEKYNHIIKASKRLSEKSQRYPSLEEIAHHTNTPLESVEKVVQSFKEAIPLDNFIEAKGEGVINPSLHHEGTAMVNKVTSSHLSQHLDEILYHLTPQEREIIKLRFGIGKGHDHTLAEIGKKFNVSRERIRQILKRALEKIKNPHSITRLKEFS